MSWQTIERPGYFGRSRGDRMAEYDRRFGMGQWRLVWQLGSRLGSRMEAAMVYEDAYLNFLGHRPDLTERLTGEARDVYDDQESNVKSGLDYELQESGRTHLQDIALRRCLVRLGIRFLGHQLVQIRDDVGASKNSLSLYLSPGRVPFHRPEWLMTPLLEGWWEAGSVECWYQSNKLLQVQSRQPGADRDR